ncbi:MAG TPA: serine/threonine-protein kinase [Luteolibacter sp.]
MSDTPPSPPGATGDETSREIERALFEAASGIEDAEVRGKFLVSACVGNAARLSRVQTWLERKDFAESFFRHAAIARTEVGCEVTQIWEGGLPQTRRLEVEPEEPGSQIGQYQLYEKIGEGGCGVVYSAQQLEPVKRRVALKVIRAGLDSSGVMSRFESERQTLALMDHPGIARVYDAGATDGGRPYFVMELVSGDKITRHCDTHQLGLRQRLELFIQACQAIQHAHQKGIIHRDIKPSNVLVADQDGTAVPKVIDFGISRAVEGRMADETSATAHGQLVGTPAYMSPEQAEGGKDPDTRGDIYSLGVLLFELLTGRTPFDGKRLTQVGLFEMLRILRDEEPPAPSVALSSLEREELAVVAAARSCSAPALIAAVRGDLDGIVAKAMAKDRENRYDTVNGLAMDLRRFLNDEPVSARPPGRLYLFGKLVRRHKLVFAAAAVATLSLVAGLVVSNGFYLRERQARQIQAKLRESADAARANEARLLVQSKVRESISQAAMLMAEGKIQEADALLLKTPMNSIEPSLEAAGVLRTLAEWNAIRQRWQQAAECYLLFMQVNRLVRLRAPDNYLLTEVAMGSTLLESENPAEYEHFRNDAIARHAKITDPIQRAELLKACLLLPANKPLLDRLESHTEALKPYIAKTTTANYQRALAALSLALMSWRNDDFTGALKWSRQCLAYPDINLSQNAAAYALASMAEQRLGQHEQARMDLNKTREILAGPFNRDAYDPRGTPHGRWFEWSIVRILEREATGLIGEKAEETR